MKKPTIFLLATSLTLFSGLQAEDSFIEEENPFIELEESILSIDDDFFLTESPSAEEAVENEVIIQIGETEELEQEEISVEAPIAQLEQEEIALEPIDSDELLSIVEEMTPETAESSEVAAAVLPPSLLESSKESAILPKFDISYEQVFKGAPIIYSLLFAMSMVTVFLWFYSLSKLKHAGKVSEPLLKEIRQKIHSSQYDEAIALCTAQNNFFCKMLAAGISARGHGLPVMIDTMKAEGRRVTISFWQRLGFLNDIAMIAPMIGLLGTVLGMFFAFYDLNRSMESFSVLFDGLGISVGTTVAGLIVAILALMLHSLAKYRLVRQLVRIENEVQSFASLIDSKASQEPSSQEGRL